MEGELQKGFFGESCPKILKTDSTQKWRFTRGTQLLGKFFSGEREKSFWSAKKVLEGELVKNVDVEFALLSIKNLKTGCYNCQSEE